MSKFLMKKKLLKKMRVEEEDSDINSIINEQKEQSEGNFRKEKEEKNINFFLLVSIRRKGSYISF